MSMTAEQHLDRRIEYRWRNTPRCPTENGQGKHARARLDGQPVTMLPIHPGYVGQHRMQFRWATR